MIPWMTLAQLSSWTDVPLTPSHAGRGTDRRERPDWLGARPDPQGLLGRAGRAPLNLPPSHPERAGRLEPIQAAAPLAPVNPPVGGVTRPEASACSARPTNCRYTFPSLLQGLWNSIKSAILLLLGVLRRLLWGPASCRLCPGPSAPPRRPRARRCSGGGVPL